MRVTGALFLATCLTCIACTANAQSPRELLGKIVKGDDPSQSPLDNVKVVLDESGSHDISRDGGLFQLFLPDVLRAGDEVTITVTVPGSAIYEPPGGKLRIPSDADLPRKRVLVQLLPKGSLKFLSDAQLRAFVERSANESSRQPSQPSSNERPDLGRYLRDWAVQNGFSVDQVRTELDRWAADVASRKASEYDLGLAAFAKNNFHEANERALDAAAEAEANLANLQKEQQENVDRAIRAYRLAGDAAYSDLEFQKAASAYSRALSHTARERNATQWADLQLRIGNAEDQLISRSEGGAIPRHAESAIKAYSLALEVFKRETLPQEWATTQNNLGNALTDLAGRSEGAQAGAYLEQAVAAYRSALQVRTREQLPQDWAATQNNLGVALRHLAGRSEGAQAGAYLEQAVAAFRSALEVQTREKLPQGWAMTQDNLGAALADLARRSEGAQAGGYLAQAVAAFRSALEVYTREQLPQDWAMTQNNLGAALDDLAGRSEGGQAAAYLEQAVAAYRSALEVYTREQLPQGWATTQNNLGNALSDLAGRSEGAQAAAYMEQAVAAYRSALEVRTEANFPAQWIQTMKNLARTYELKSDWSNARRSYEQLLHHEPDNAEFQAKIRELAEKQ